MRTVFADTFYWIASINRGDDRHEAVKRIARTLSNAYIVTTDEVLTEVLNYCSTRGTPMRQRGTNLVNSVLSNPMMQVVQQTRESFLSGVAFYKQRSDKGYSLTDCISMNTMRELNITEVLTQDKHFTQEGFTILITE